MPRRTRHGFALVALALAGSSGAFGDDLPADVDPIADVRAAEWARAAPSALATAAADPDPEVRIAAATALGRLADPDALPAIEALAADPDEDVRRAADEALGYTPGAAPIVRRLLDAEPAVARWLSPSTPGGERRAALLHALGRTGDGTDVARLTAAISEPWPTGAAAADAIARLARRKVDGTAAAVPALVECLVRIDPRAVDGCAHALRRTEMATADDTAVATVIAGWERLPTAASRAWALRGVWGRMTAEQRGDALQTALASPDGIVRIAALDAVGAGDGPFSAVVAAVDDRRPDVRAAAIAAMGRIGGANAGVVLGTHAADPDPWLAADARAARLVAGGSVDPAVATDPTKPVPIRAVEVEALTDANALVLLCADPSPVIRSTAALRLLELPEPLSPDAAILLLGSEDLVVRQVAIEVLANHEGRTGAVPAPLVGALVPLLRVEIDPDVLASGFALLAKRAGKRPKDFTTADSTLRGALLRALGHPDAPVRAAAEELRAALQIPIEGVIRREEYPTPALAEVARVASARIVTDRGEFRVELWPQTAPIAVANFARLADAGFYDGVVFHRVVPGFVAQTGDPRGDGNGGPGYTIPDEVSDLPYVAGSIGMARAGADTGGSQWFVTLSPQPHLTGDYTQFGAVTQGLHVAKSLRRGDRVVEVIIERTAPK